MLNGQEKKMENRWDNIEALCDLTQTALEINISGLQSLFPNLTEEQTIIKLREQFHRARLYEDF